MVAGNANPGWPPEDVSVVSGAVVVSESGVSVGVGGGEDTVIVVLAVLAAPSVSITRSPTVVSPDEPKSVVAVAPVASS